MPVSRIPHVPLLKLQRKAEGLLGLHQGDMRRGGAWEWEAIKWQWQPQQSCIKGGLATMCRRTSRQTQSCDGMQPCQAGSCADG